MPFTLRQLAADILRETGWDPVPLPLVWSPRMAWCAGLFVAEQDIRGVWCPDMTATTQKQLPAGIPRVFESDGVEGAAPKWTATTPWNQAIRSTLMHDRP